LDLKLWVEEHRGEVPTDEVIDKRITRFKNAFDTIFQNLNFYKITVTIQNLLSKDDICISI